MNKDKRIELPDEIFQKAYALKSDGGAWHASALDEIAVKNYLKRGLLFKTEDSARKYDRNRQFLVEMQNWAAEYNGGWRPNWHDMKEDKYCVELTTHTGHFYIVRRNAINHIGLLPCFKTHQIAAEFIAKFGMDIQRDLLD
jgi:hypothetical protein